MRLYKLFMNHKSKILITSIAGTTILLICQLTTMTITSKSVYGLDISSRPSAFYNNESLQPVQDRQQQLCNNATIVLISTIKSTRSILAQVLNDINMNNTKDALSNLSALKTKIEQYELSALDVLSNPILQSSRIHLAAAEDAINSGNAEKAISELNMAGQLKIQHQQGMMEMKLPMSGEMNSTFNSLEAHLLDANEAVNAGYTQKALSDLNIASDQLYQHQLSMIDFINSIFNNTRSHLKQSLDDLKGGDRQTAISELAIVGQLLSAHQHGILTMIGISKL
jgi:hypothetical protein